MLLRAVSGTIRHYEVSFKVTTSGLRASFWNYLKEFLQIAALRTKNVKSYILAVYEWKGTFVTSVKAFYQNLPRGLRKIMTVKNLCSC